MTRTYSIDRKVPVLQFHTQRPCRLRIERFKFNSPDPDWVNRLAPLSIGVFIAGTRWREEQDDSETLHWELQTESIGALLRNSMVQPILELNWAFQPQNVTVEGPDILWVYSVHLEKEFKLMDDESIDLTVQTAARHFDIRGMISGRIKVSVA